MAQGVLNGFVLLNNAHDIPHKRSPRSATEGRNRDDDRGKIANTNNKIKINDNGNEIDDTKRPQEVLAASVCGSTNNQNTNNTNNQNQINNEKTNKKETITFGRVVVVDLLLFTRLVFLDVSYNCLRFMDFSVLPALKELRMTNNHISTIHCPSSGFKSLRKLDLSNNSLNEQSIARLGTLFQNKLTHLNLSNNYLSILPKEICLLQKLENLILDNNQLTNTQLSLLGFLPKIEMLSMNNNKITKYIHHSGIYLHLEKLYLNSNYVSSLQELMDLTKLSDIRKVEIQNNPFILEGGSLEVPLFSFNQRHVLFFTGVLTQDIKETSFDKQRKKKKTRQAEDILYQLEMSSEDDIFVQDWIPDFILDELYGHTSTKKVNKSSQQILKALRTTIQRPPATVHFMPIQRANSKIKRKKLAALAQAEQEAGSMSHRDSDRDRDRDNSLSRSSSSKSISNLSEAEVALDRMKQRLFIAERNFEEMISMDKSL